MLKHEEWILYAEQDLLSSKALLEIQILRNALYHSQQCAEKSLKGYLCFKKEKIKKTHDLAQLLLQCTKIDQEFIILKQHVDILNPYSIRTRYPDDFIFISSEEIEDMVKEAISLAQEILNLVKIKFKN